VSGLGLRFELPGGGHVLFTGREEGNLSSVSGEGCEHGADARERLRGGLGLQSLARGHQVHGTVVERIEARRASDADGRHADGQVTSLTGVGALVLAADCLPVALGSAGGVAILHVGWRGLAAGVLESGVAALRELGQEGPIAAVIGPGAGVCCYEVGQDVGTALGEAQRDGGHIDLRAIAHERLLGVGVAEVREAAHCTICDERFFSHRREGASAGRQGGVAWRS
jgi:YfiH family protein